MSRGCIEVKLERVYFPELAVFQLFGVLLSHFIYVEQLSL